MGMESHVKAALFQVTSESFVQECSYGILGSITGNQKKICRDRRYIPKESIITEQFLDSLDKTTEVMPYECSY